MDFEWIAIALGDVVWISLAFVLGLLSRSIGLPPLIGFLVTGFILSGVGFSSGATLEKLSDLGITLLLFTVGLKLNLRTLVRPQVWAVTGAHSAIVVAVLGLVFYGLAWSGVSVFADMGIGQALLVAFALSFSSTVFVVKTLEEKGEMASLHGRIAIGILIMQDIVAVVFLSASTGKWPTVWAPVVLLLIPLRPLLHKLLVRVGHGELLVLYGLLLALGGAELFEIVGLKGDLGALIIGVLIANHAKSDELAKTMLGFKDLFLLGFFLSIGFAGHPTTETIIVGIILSFLMFFKSALFFALLTGFFLRARTSLLASVNLSNYSEFGLIVAAIGVSRGWLDSQWLVIIAIALSLSFAYAAGLSDIVRGLYTKHRPFWKKLQRSELHVDDQRLDIKGVKVAVIGMGGVGSGAYDKMREVYGDTILGVEIEPNTALSQLSLGRRVLQGDPSDADFWDRVQEAHTLELVMLALPNLSTNLAVIEELKAVGYEGKIAATAKFPDQVTLLKEAGATTVFNVYTEMGAGFASHTIQQSLE